MAGLSVGARIFLIKASTSGSFPPPCNMISINLKSELFTTKYPVNTRKAQNAPKVVAYLSIPNFFLLWNENDSIKVIARISGRKFCLVRQEATSKAPPKKRFAELSEKLKYSPHAAKRIANS